LQLVGYLFESYDDAWTCKRQIHKEKLTIISCRKMPHPTRETS